MFILDMDDLSKPPRGYMMMVRRYMFYDCLSSLMTVHNDVVLFGGI